MDSRLRGNDKKTMLYFFHGTDAKKASDKANALIQKMLDKKPNASLFNIDDENCKEGTLQEMTQSSALFQNKYIVRIKRTENREQRTVIISFLKEIKESENIFIWYEGDLTKSEITKIEKFAEKVVDVGGTKKEYEGKKIFDICAPLIDRDKKKLWTKYQELLEDFPPEEIHGTMFWQMKNICIAHKANQKDSGLAPFPYSQAKRGTAKYSEEEALLKANSLTQIVHEARAGGAELKIALEKFILEL
jgi:hypothetical protein